MFLAVIRKLLLKCGGEVKVAGALFNKQYDYRPFC
jgi:hypothetical protein